MSESPQTSAPDGAAGQNDFDHFCDFLFTAMIVAPKDLRAQLKLDELSFRHVAPHVLVSSKDVFLYRILDEIQKAGVSHDSWCDRMEQADKLDIPDEQMKRVIHEALSDDQSFRARKLVECLVDLICFSQTDDDIYYRDFFLLQELSEYVGAQRDREEFFAFKSANSAYAIERLAEHIRHLEKSGLDPARRWYLSKPAALCQTWMTKGFKFASFRQRYKMATKHCLPNEAVILGKSYIHAYGMSKNVHFTAGDTSSQFNDDEVRRGVDRVGLLCLSLITRCQIAMNVVPDGINRNLRQMHDSNTEAPKQLIEKMKAENMRSGDFAWAKGYLAEVIESRKSQYGFRSYHVKFIDERPIAAIADDWLASGEARLFLDSTTAEDFGQKMVLASHFSEQDRGKLSSLLQTNRAEALRIVARTLWHTQFNRSPQNKASTPHQ
jgi:hypothetical protein